LIARSNIIRTPLAGPSDVIDEEWMLIDIDELYYTRDWNDSISSAGFRKRKRAQEWLSSGAISSPIKKAKKSK
ncbi:MAG: DUF4912 domain-containing protein, partial [Candidatus Omnitrophica bacterium]|nr:DUF4912 domain-containing protein [Candidatus Omnitrophota bacterium]